VPGCTIHVQLSALGELLLVSDLIIRVHLVSGDQLEFPITLERAIETVQRNRQPLEFEGWKPEAIDSTDRTIVREIRIHLYGDALRTGPGSGFHRRKPEDPGWLVPQGMFYLTGGDNVTAIPARNIVAISITDPDARSGARPGFAPREGDVTS
jgi:hypothetical protein